MTRPYFVLVSLLALACVAFLGCSGGSDGPAPNPFLGRWAGGFRDAVAGQAGTMRLSVSAEGIVTGDFTNLTLGVGGTIKGKIDRDGKFVGTHTWPEVATGIGLEGTLTRGANTHVTGTLAQTGANPLGVDLLPRALLATGRGTGSVTANDLEFTADGSHVRLMDFIPQTDCTLRLTMRPADVHGLKDPYLLVYDANGPYTKALASDDDSGGGANARLDFDFAHGRKYVIGFNGDGADDFGDYVYWVETLSSHPGSAPTPDGRKVVR